MIAQRRQDLHQRQWKYNHPFLCEEAICGKRAISICTLRVYVHQTRGTTTKSIHSTATGKGCAWERLMRWANTRAWLRLVIDASFRSGEPICRGRALTVIAHLNLLDNGTMEVTPGEVIIVHQGSLAISKRHVLKVQSVARAVLCLPHVGFVLCYTGLCSDNLGLFLEPQEEVVCPRTTNG